MLLLLFMVLGMVGWLIVALRIDKISRPLNEVRDAYQALALVTMFLLILVTYRANTYRLELREANRIVYNLLP